MKINKKVIIYLGLIIIGIIGIIVYIKAKENSPQICINNICFSIEIADTPEKREYGLMNRISMPELSGMLFKFDQEGSYTFWMKNTLIPLDMIWIDSGMNIIGIMEADPCTTNECQTFNPGGTALYILELNKGISKKYNIKVGNKVLIQQ